MDQKEFMRQQAAATERMRRMYERSQFKDDPHTMPPAPDFVRVGGKDTNRNPPERTAQTDNTARDAVSAQNQKNNTTAKNSGVPSIFGENFLTSQLKEPDTALILGLLLLLFSENADRRLLFALLYILM